MTIEELIKKLETECNSENIESNHRHADTLLLDFIGNREVNAAFVAIRRRF